MFCHLNHALNFNLLVCLINPTQCDPTHINTKCNQSQHPIMNIKKFVLLWVHYKTKQNNWVFHAKFGCDLDFLKFILSESNSYVLKWTINHWRPPSFLSLLELTFTQICPAPYYTLVQVMNDISIVDWIQLIYVQLHLQESITMGF